MHRSLSGVFARCRNATEIEVLERVAHGGPISVGKDHLPDFFFHSVLSFEKNDETTGHVRRRRVLL
jgi:hypothetical protein